MLAGGGPGKPLSTRGRAEKREDRPLGEKEKKAGQKRENPVKGPPQEGRLSHAGDNHEENPGVPDPFKRGTSKERKRGP